MHRADSFRPVALQSPRGAYKLLNIPVYIEATADLFLDISSKVLPSNVWAPVCFIKGPVPVRLTLLKICFA